MTLNEAREKELEELKMWNPDVEIAAINFPFKDDCINCEFLKVEIIRMPVHRKMMNGYTSTTVGPKIVCCKNEAICRNAVRMDFCMRNSNKKKGEAKK